MILGVDRAGMGGGTTSAGQPTGTMPQLADFLINGYWQANSTIAHQWASSTITYNLGNLTPSEQALAVAALNAWHEVANITFVQTSGSANITFNHDGTMQAYSSSSWNGLGQMSSSLIVISSDWITNDGGAMDGRTGIYSYGYQTYLHEIGHSLGLGHQGPYNGSASYGTNNVYANDTWQFSVMSYFSQPNYDNGSYNYVITPQMADITAVQLMYGAASTRTGDTVYGFNSNAGPIYDFTQYAGLGTPAFTVYDSGGTDTLDCSGYANNQTINLTPGTFSSIGGFTHNVAIFTTTVIETAIGGTGNDTLIANDFGCTLIGNAGSDALYGGTANDTLNGGSGSDALTGGTGSDTYIFAAGYGSDVIADFVAGAGGVDVINLQGMSGINTLADVLSHATQVGANTVINFGGGDVLTLQNVTMGNLVAGDFVFANSPQQTDLTASNLVLNALNVSLSYNLNNIGALAALASTTAIYLSTDSTITTGDTLLTTIATPGLSGNSSDNEIAFLTLPTNLTAGVYYIGVLADYNTQIAEADETNNSAAIAVILGNNNAGTLNGTSGNDIMFAFAGDDTIIGGTGADTMVGGTGNDTYFVDNLGDIVLENLNDGTDVIFAVVSGYTLPTNIEVGVLNVANGGTLTGNNLGNVLWSTSNNGTLVGGTGADVLYGINGNQTLRGGVGDDITFVGGLSDVVIENAGEGTDIVYTSVSGYTLAANVEIGVINSGVGLTLTATAWTIRFGAEPEMTRSTVAAGMTFCTALVAMTR